MGILPICALPGNDASSLPCLGHIRQLTSCVSVREVPPQQVLHSPGEDIHFAHFICEGIVKVTHTMPDGKRVIIGLRRGGWLLGLASIIMEIPYPNTAETVTRCKICSYPVEELKRAMATNAALGQWVAKLLASGFYASIITIRDKSLLSGRERLERFLLEMAEPLVGRNGSKEVKLQILLKQWEVAQLLSLTPQHLARLIRQLETDGLLSRKKGWLVLTDPEGLKQNRMEPLMILQER